MGKGVINNQAHRVTTIEVNSKSPSGIQFQIQTSISLEDINFDWDFIVQKRSRIDLSIFCFFFLIRKNCNIAMIKSTFKAKRFL